MLSRFIRKVNTVNTMPSRREKNQDRQDKDRIERRKQKRTQRRGTSLSDDNTSGSSTVNGRITDMTQVSQARDRDLEENVNKILSLGETFQHLASVAGILPFIEHSAASAANAFGPEIELKAENERLQQTLREIKQAVETQEVRDLRQRCDQLEADRVQLDRLRQEFNKERQQLAIETDAVHAEQLRITKELEDTKRHLKDQYHGDLEKEKKKYRERFALIQQSKQKLEQMNEELTASRDDIDQQARDLQEGNATLMAKNRTLRSQLERETSRFSLQSKGIEYYRAEFGKLDQQLDKLVYDFITGPVNDNQIRAVEDDGLEDHDCFKFVPTGSTEVAHYLWRRGAQAFITSQLCKNLWQAYPCDQLQDCANPEPLEGALDMFSRKFAAINPEKESIWRTITHEILSSLSTQPSEVENLDGNIVSGTSTALNSIIDPSKQQDFESELSDIVRHATSLWSATKIDTSRIWISANPPRQTGKDQKWKEASLKGIQSVQKPEAGPIDGAQSLCLFPLIATMGPSGSFEIVYPGQALFADGLAFALGNHEQKEIATMLAQKQRELRHNYRKNSANSQSILAMQDLAHDLPQMQGQ